MYLAIDPGKRTGFARFGEDGELLEVPFMLTPEDKALDYLESVEGVKVIILETYRNRPGVGHNTWSTGPTQQHIGAIKRIARKRLWKVVEQEPKDLYMGLRHIGMYTQYPKGKHVPDEISAYAHGEFYLRKAKVK